MGPGGSTGQELTGVTYQRSGSPWIGLGLVLLAGKPKFTKSQSLKIQPSIFHILFFLQPQPLPVWSFKEEWGVWKEQGCWGQTSVSSH